ncbi:MAG TPA: trehalase family glycosidase [Candidatus Aminicenantes bacterium]|nr:trehalase family glycosidase [Candidatus Aminicenantes bacterium]HRY64569.1 trehalase family glycosidase [Candidatus Aminicenantes bacterium]HRZ71482.1 trehalase family glycosidase [Candidatus Aminicenantes bacterium]
MKARLSRGWNTWDTRSVLSHVLLPEGFSVSLRLVNHRTGDTLKEALPARGEDGAERVVPGPHAWDGSYTEVVVEWQGIRIGVRSAAVDNGFFLQIIPHRRSPGDALLMDPQMLWGRPGKIMIKSGTIRADTPSGQTELAVAAGRYLATDQHLEFSLAEPIAVTTDRSKTAAEIGEIIDRAEAQCAESKSKYPEAPDAYEALRTVLAWNTIYDPGNDRVISPVSRAWSTGGWVLFEWDTYFAAYMLSVDCKELAYSNAIAITSEITDRGFVPNNSQPGIKSLDRSQPPVGAFVIREIYRRYPDRWFLDEVFDSLLRWNRWWAADRDIDGYLSYGSDPYDHGKASPPPDRGIGNLQGAKWESGLDNSPMYDEAVYDRVAHQMLLADVGLISLYINDCRSLSEIAAVLGRTEAVRELNERAAEYSRMLGTLWDAGAGLYLNRDLLTGEPSRRLSPTLFYPLLAKVPDQKQAERMIKEHFYNPREFWGEFIMPSIARNDPAFKDNHYWRGRIWAPMNFLVYLGLRNYELPRARKDLAERSETLLLRSWLGERHVYENYNAETGRGDDAGSWSDEFYHWGALLGFIRLMDKGYVPSPELPLQANPREP